MLLLSAQLQLQSGASGIIATNTTVDYFLTPNAKDFGGISGRLLKQQKSFEHVKVIGKRVFMGRQH